jgi:CheY-like chemotaxis protein
LAGGIAHDFNNLLFAIVANVEIIQSSLPDIQGINGNLSNILKAGEQATSLCSQLLNYAGKGNFDIRPLDLKKIISDSLTLVKVSISKKADIQMELPDHLPLIDADASQIRQVLINLLANASESFAGNSGKIIISAETKKYVQDELNLMQLGSNLNAGKYVTLRVKDNGSGMDETILAKIFDPFFTTKYTGRGLGLSAMLGILRRHGGAVRVTSKLGCGSEFVLIFPISSQSSFPQFTVEGTKTECNIRGLILAADDEPFVLDVIQKMLQRYGLQVVTAANGQEAVTVFQQHQKQIILAMLDVTMPKLNGVETFRELRKMSPNLPVIFCSGYNQESVFDYIKQEKSVCFLCKPFRQAMLKESIQTLLKQVQVDS